jgi:hypothetical protein
MLSGRLGVRAVVGCLAVVVILAASSLRWGPSPRAQATEDSKGTDFWLMFNQNFSTPELTLFITGKTSTTGTVEIPGLGFSEPFSVVPGTVTPVSLPPGAAVTGIDTVSDLGVHVTALQEVTVYGLNRVPFTTDAYLGLPTDILGQEYIVLAYGSFGMQFGIVATQDDTTVTITPTTPIGSHPAGVPYNVELDRGQTYQAQGSGEVTGTIITSNKPIAVFGSNACTTIPLGTGVCCCDHIVEQMAPTTTWGERFVTVPLETRLNGDTFRFLASSNNTTISVNGTVVATINRGQFHERILTGPSTITASAPILVAQYSNSSSFDGVTSDPFMMLIPPFEQFLAEYTITTPATGFRQNYVNVVAPTAAVGATTLDGVPIPVASFTPIGSTGFSGAVVPLALGSHNLAGPQPFGIFVYGFDEFDSYGYPGGLALGQVATVTTVNLSPATSTGSVNTEHCVTAAVRDQNAAPVSGIRVDFTVSAPNPETGFEFTGAGGDAQFCYTGTATGTDTITASVGALSDTATRTWTSTTGLTCDMDGDQDVDVDDLARIRQANGQSAAPGNPLDANGDGRINVADSRFCSLRCTAGGCGVSRPGGNRVQ